jgi:hypothetical protein
MREGQEPIAGTAECGRADGNLVVRRPPPHYQGEARSAAAEVGERLLGATAQVLARSVHVIKEGTVSKRLLGEFYAASGAPLRL